MITSLNGAQQKHSFSGFLGRAALIVVAVAGWFVVPQPQASATASPCSFVFTPVFPKEVALSKETTTVAAHLITTGSTCPLKSSYEVRTEFPVDYQGKTFAMGHELGAWIFESSSGPALGPEGQDVYASDLYYPGTQRLHYGTNSAPSTYCLVDYGDGSGAVGNCTVRPTSFVVKFAGRPRMSVRRSGSYVTFESVKATRYSRNQTWIPISDTVAIQRLYGKTWKTIHSASAHRPLGYSWRYKNLSRSRYRVIQSQTAAAFRGIGAEIVK